MCRKGLRTPSCAGCWLRCRRGLGLPECKHTRASKAGAEAGLMSQESRSIDTVLPIQEAHLSSTDSAFKLPVPPSSMQRRPRPTLVSQELQLSKEGLGASWALTFQQCVLGGGCCQLSPGFMHHRRSLHPACLYCNCSSWSC